PGSSAAGRAGDDVGRSSRAPRRGVAGSRRSVRSLPPRSRSWSARRQNGGGVVPHPGPRGARERCVAVARGERGVVHRQELRRVSRGGGDGRPRGELGVFRGDRELLVPGTYVLADVAAEQPVAHLDLLGGGERAASLDREIRDAAARVQLARGDEGLGGAGVEAAAAGAAAVATEGEIRRQGGV